MWRSRRSTFLYIQKGGTDRHEVRTGFVRIGTRTHLSRFLLSISVSLWSWGESLIVADGSLKSNTATNESWMAKVYLRNYSNGQLGLNFCSNFCLEDPPVPLFVIGGSHISSRICIRNDRSVYSIGGLYYPAERTLIECVRRQEQQLQEVVFTTQLCLLWFQADRIGPIQLRITYIKPFRLSMIVTRFNDPLLCKVKAKRKWVIRRERIADSYLLFCQDKMLYKWN